MNPYPGWRASAQLVVLARAVSEVATDAGDQRLAGYLRHVEHEFCTEVITPGPAEVALHHRDLVAMLQSLVSHE